MLAAQIGLCLIQNRRQIVAVGKTQSDPASVTCGVPHCNKLDPLLCLCYVNDVVINIDSDCKLLLYVDDSSLLFSHKDPDVTASKLGKVLESCSSWLVDNKLSLHLAKTEYRRDLYFTMHLVI